MDSCILFPPPVNTIRKLERDRLGGILHFKGEYVSWGFTFKEGSSSGVLSLRRVCQVWLYILKEGSTNGIVHFKGGFISWDFNFKGRFIRLVFTLSIKGLSVDVHVKSLLLLGISLYSWVLTCLTSFCSIFFLIQLFHQFCLQRVTFVAMPYTSSLPDSYHFS